jgi:hypothetical protein
MVQPDFKDITPATRSGKYPRQPIFGSRQTMAKDEKITIRISGRDLELLKTMAMDEGLPYQTMVTSVLHKYVTGKLKE